MDACKVEGEKLQMDKSICSNCGRCVDACPEKLIPARLSQFALHHDMKSFEKWYGMECIECGSCSYVCPSRRMLAQSIKSMRQTVLAERRKQNAKGGK